jgi:endoglucanase
MKAPIFGIAALASGVASQQTGWGQCGGQGWTGPTTCVSGWTCTFSNPWYSQCLPGGASSSTAATTTVTSTTTRTTTTTTTSTTSQPTGTTGKFKWFGVNEAGAEFGQATYPGTWGTHFIFPDPNTISVSFPCAQIPSPRAFGSMIR